MVLLIVSLMTVVGAFLMNSVVRFYLNDFNERMTTMFSAENMDFYAERSPVDTIVLRLEAMSSIYF